MRTNILVGKNSSGTIIISMLCLISIVMVSCDNMRFSMVPGGDPAPDRPDATHIVDTIDYIKALHTKREELQAVLAKERNVEVVSFPDRLVIPRLNIAKPLDSIDQWIHDVNTTEIIKALNDDLEKLQQDIAAVRNKPSVLPEPPGIEPPQIEPTPPEPPRPEPPQIEPTPPKPPRPEPPQVEPSPIFRVGDRIFVRNTGDDGIRIRYPLGGGRIGGMFDGETGVVISDSREFRGLIWVEIKWDAPVKNPDSGCGIGANVCMGWSAVIVENGTQVIHKQQ